MRRLLEGLLFCVLASTLGAPATAQQPAGSAFADPKAGMTVAERIKAERRERRAAREAIPERERWTPWKNRLIYGRPITTREERQEFHRTIQSLPTYDEQLAYWQAHVERMQKRALELGVSIPDPPVRPGSNRRIPADIYGRHLMTLEERDAYIKQWRQLETPEEIAAFEAAHAVAMQERAEAWSIYLAPPGYLPEQARAHFEHMKEVRKLADLYFQELMKRTEDGAPPAKDGSKAAGRTAGKAAP